MLNIKEIVIASKGKLLNGNENSVVKSYRIDSREVEILDFFIPIKGEKIDSHKFLEDISSKGAIGFFLEESYYDKNIDIINDIISKYKDINIILVENSLKALYEIGKYNRSIHMNIPVIAITGSVGKTSTKEIISSVFETEYNVLKTYKNFNGYIGLSLMLLMLENQDIAILEHGIDVKGEMNLLASSSKPTYSVITNIGMSHIENFGSRENIGNEKLIIADYTEKLVYVNGEDDILNNTANSKYYLSEIEDILQNGNQTTYYTKIYNDKTKIEINEYGNHNIFNSLVAIRIAEKFNMDKNNIVKGIKNYRNYGRRFEVKNLKSGKILVDDTYNASFDSFKSGLESLTSFNMKKIVILGDILETGKYAEQLHRNVGKLFKNINVDEVITIGNNAKFINIEASKYVRTKYYEDKIDIIKYINSIKEKDIVVYLKASNGMKFIDIVNKIN